MLSEKQFSLGDRVFGIINATILIFVCIVVLYPIYYMFIVSISDGMAVLRGDVYIWPVKINLNAYKTLLQDPNISNSYLNTIKYTFFGTIINVGMTAFCAYPLSRKKMYGRRTLNFIVIFTMLFDAGFIAHFMVVNNLHLKNSIWAILIPPAVNVWYMIIMRTFFQEIPEELYESAYIDGSNDIKTFFRIIIPVSTPVIATMVLFYAVWHWNSFMPALLYMDDRINFPMQMIMRNIVITGEMASSTASMNTTSDVSLMTTNIKYAVTFITVAPVLLIYPFVQKYFTKGIMVGSLKG